MASSNEILVKAEARRDSLLRELDELEKFIHTYRALQIGAPLDAVPRPSSSTKTARPPEIILHVVKLLEMREPRSTDEILKKLAEDGFLVGGRDPKRNLSSILSHTDEFDGVRGRGWLRVKAIVEPDENSFPGLPTAADNTEGDLDDEIPF